MALDPGFGLPSNLVFSSRWEKCLANFPNLYFDPATLPKSQN